MAAFSEKYDISKPTARSLPKNLDDMIRVDIKTALAERYALGHIALDDADVDETSSTCAGRHIAGGCSVCLVDTWYNIMRVVPTCSNTIAYATDSKQFYSYNTSAVEWQWLNIVDDAPTAWDYFGHKQEYLAIVVGANGLTDSERYSQAFTTTGTTYYVVVLNHYFPLGALYLYNARTFFASMTLSIYLDDELLTEWVVFDNTHEYPCGTTLASNEYHGKIETAGVHTIKVLANATFSGINITTFTADMDCKLGIFSDASFSWS